MAEIKDLVIYGAGGLGREILSLIRRDYADEWRVVGFIDDSYDMPEIVDGIKLLPRNYLDNNQVAVVFGFASPDGKAKLYNELSKRRNLSFPNIISKKASVSPEAYIGYGVVIQDFCVISINVRLGDATFINFHSVLGHDVSIDAFCTIMPTVNISGYVTVGKSSLIGAQSFILQGKKIGKGVTVSAGSKVFNDIPDIVTVLGNPAIIISKSKANNN